MTPVFFGFLPKVENDPREDDIRYKGRGPRILDQGPLLTSSVKYAPVVLKMVFLSLSSWHETLAAKPGSVQF